MSLPKPYFQDEHTTLYHADCMAVLPYLGPADAVLTDPPYDEETHAGARSRRDLNVSPVTFDHVSPAAISAVFERCAELGVRWVVATMSWRHVAHLAKEPPAEMRFVRFGVWIKPNGAPQFSGDRPGMGWEAVGIFHRLNGRMEWNGGGRSSVFTHGQSHNSGLPAVSKPLPLMHELCSLFSNPADVIVDPFAGAGTTLVAAKNLGRKAIGIEKDEAMCALAVQRLAQGVLPLETA